MPFPHLQENKDMRKGNLTLDRVFGPKLDDQQCDGRSSVVGFLLLLEDNLSM